MELRQISERAFYIPNVTNIGVVKTDEKAILIDTGLDDDTAKKAIQVLEKNGLCPEAIINTHSHADHFGGNAYIRQKTGAAAYAAGIEACMIEYPYFEPFYLFSGANPINVLKNKFLMAKPSHVDYIIPDKDEKLAIGSLQLQVVKLPGHSPDHIGIVVDDILFCGDAIFSEDVLAKHKIPFGVDIDKQKETLEFLKGSGYRLYVPSHSEPVSGDGIYRLACANIKVINRIEEYILSSVEEGKTTEEIMKNVFDHFDMEIKGVQQYYLMHTVSMAYLGALYQQNKLRITISENTLLWNKV